MLIIADKSFLSLSLSLIMFIALLQSHFTLNYPQPVHQSEWTKNKRFPGGNKNTTHRQFLTVPSRKHSRKYDGVHLLQNMNCFFPLWYTSTSISKLPCLFFKKNYYEMSDGKKKTSLKGVDMFVCLLFQAERGLNTSQANSQDSSYFAGMPHAGN